MKKLLIVLMILSLLTLVITLSLTVLATEQGRAVPDTVYLSETGSDSGEGTKSSPYLTLEKALEKVADGGTIEILDSIALTTDFNWESHGKSVIITGGVLDLSAWGSNGHLNIRDNVTFTDIELTFATINWDADNDQDADPKSSSSTTYPRTHIYANGHHLVIAKDVTFTYDYNTNVYLFGGTKGGTVNGDTNLEVYAGTYTYIFGGGNGGTVKGDTHVTVGGTVNPTAKVDNHDTNYNIYGGGWKDTITGSTYLTVQDSAKAIYARGGSYASGSQIGGYMNTTFTGGTLMNLSGGSASANTGLGANVTMTGGSVQQVFGGNTGAAFGTSTAPVTVNLRILGGTVTRRIYGGCYNEYENTSTGLLPSYDYSTSHYVYGSIILTMDTNATVSFSGSYADQSIFACSRYGGSRTGESTRIIYTSSAAYSEFNSKLGVNDWASSLIGLMKNVSAADETHVCTYTTSSNTITETCSLSGCGHTASATVKLDPAASLVYSGQAIEPAYIEYSNGWKSETTFGLSYSDNVNAGTATVTMSNHLGSASLDFTIERAPSLYGAPALGKTNETVKGKADGRITGLTATMEYSTDGMSYTTVTPPNMSFASGTYYIRYAATANHAPSPSATVTIQEGKMLKVTFKAAGSQDIVKEVTWDATLTDIPTVPEKVGYTDTAPYWDTTDFTHIKADMTVNAVYTPNQFIVTLPTDTVGYTVTASSDTTVSYGDALTFTVNLGAGYSKTSDFTVKVNGTPVTLNGTNSYTVQGVSQNIVITVAGIADITAPSLKVTIGSDSWSTLANRISFSKYFKEATEVRLRALDSGSGVQGFWYYISDADSALTVAQLEALPAAAWQVSTNFDLMPCEKAVIYVKAIDNDGNIAYASSDGITFDTILPVISGIENGTDYYEEITFTVTESNLKDVTVDENYVTLNDGSYTLPADNQLHTVIVTDKAGNAVTVTVGVYGTVTVTFVADGATIATKTVTYGSAVTDIPAIPTKEGYTDTAPYWSVLDLSAVTADMTVTAIYIQNTPAAPESDPDTTTESAPNSDSETEDFNDASDNSDTADHEKKSNTALFVVIPIVACVAVGGTITGVIFYKKKRA